MRTWKITHTGPVSGMISYWIGRFWMWLFGWDVVGQVPPGGKFVLIGAPHTSNWDFPFALAALYVFRLKISWLGKHTLFKKPFGNVMRWLGGIPINREIQENVVDQIVKQFRTSQQLVVVLAPSGTRKKRDYWKSGFYWIANSAQVPILCGYLDYYRKKACLGLSFLPTGDVKKDMDRIRDFYEGVQGKQAELATRIRLIDENT
ncbi:MAG: lysophospholipid acyltransferase family protein [Syntrophobacterales bacterium]|jgi:1-acyl-sn-glycerol-3-phosphate acyltransferase